MTNFTFIKRIPYYSLFLFLFMSPMLLSGQCAPDTEDPTAKCKDISPYWEIGNALIITAADINNGSTDNCSIASMTIDKSSFNCDNLGDNTVTLTVTDNAGNTTQCTSTVLVRDNIAPRILCIDPAPTYTNSTEAFVTVPTPVISDNCALAPEGMPDGIPLPLTNDYTNTADASTAYPVGVTQVTWTVFDEAGSYTDCVVDVKVINGEDPNITLSSQAELNDFVSNYDNTPITGNLTISGADITDLSGLKNLKSISGDLRIEANEVLTNLDGLHKLDSIGGALIIYGNPALTNIDGLCNLTAINSGLSIIGNLVLANVDGLQNLNNIGGNLNISFNDILTNVDGLQGLNEIGGYLFFIFNDALINIDGLQNLSAINGRYVNIIFNGALTEYCGLFNLSTSVPNGFIYADIYNNANNPSLEEIANGEACSRILLGLPKGEELPALPIPYLVLFGLTILGATSLGMRRLI